MFLRPSIVLPLLLAFAATTVSAEDHSLGKSGTPPKDLAEGVVKSLDATGLAVKSGDDVVAEIWFAKEPPLTKNPSFALGVSYKFDNGQLLGALHVTGKGEFGDFRDQSVKKGVYTLRYGRQPEDGNHIGTSETADFLLALPAAMDKDPKPLDFSKLTTTSAKSVSSSHPAIFSMLPPGKAPEKASLESEGDFQVLTLALPAKSGDKVVKVPVRVVVVGHGDE